MSINSIIIIAIFAIISLIGLRLYSGDKITKILFSVLWVVMLVLVIGTLLNEFLPGGMNSLWNIFKPNLSEESAGEPVKPDYIDETINDLEYSDDSIVIVVSNDRIFINDIEIESIDAFEKEIQVMNLNDKEVVIIDDYAFSTTMREIISILKAYHKTENGLGFDRMEPNSIYE